MTWLGRTDLLVSVLGMLAYTGRKKGNRAFKILMRRKRPQRKTRARKVTRQRSKKGIEYLFVRINSEDLRHKDIQNYSYRVEI